MQKLLKFSLLTSLSFSLGTSLVAEESLSKAFENTTTAGNIRISAISDKNGDADALNSIAGGGSFSAQTSSYKNISLGATFHTTNAVIKGDEPNSGPFVLSSENKSYTILSEAFIQANFAGTEIKLGRQMIDTPFANTDEIGMIPNSFEAYLLTNKNIRNLTIVAGLVRKMSGVDVPTGIPEKFNDLNEDKGIYVVGLNYVFGDLDFNGWWYEAPDMRTYLYGDATAEYLFGEDFILDGGFQIIAQKDQTDADTGGNMIVGAYATGVHEASGIEFTVATNVSNGDLGDENGFGEGPFFTSAEVNTLADTGAKGSAFLFGLGYGFNQISLGANYILLIPDEEQFESNLNEIDLNIGYQALDNLSLELIVAQYDTAVEDSMSEVDSNYQVRFFTNYSF